MADEALKKYKAAVSSLKADLKNEKATTSALRTRLKKQDGDHAGAVREEQTKRADDNKASKRVTIAYRQSVRTAGQLAMNKIKDALDGLDKAISTDPA